MKGYFDENPELIREYAELTYNSPRGYNGIICHPKNSDLIWVDVVVPVKEI